MNSGEESELWNDITASPFFKTIKADFIKVPILYHKNPNL
jgi:hypothetical protein